MLQFKLIDVGVGVGMDIMDKVEAVVMVAIILRIKVIIISLKTRTIPPTNRSLIVQKKYLKRQQGHITKRFMRLNVTDVE